MTRNLLFLLLLFLRSNPTDTDIYVVRIERQQQNGAIWQAYDIYDFRIPVEYQIAAGALGTLLSETAQDLA